ncbi:MAG: hypothetical protein AB4042_07410 [Leptolyngbyaceae cyanobacterium]
MKRIGLVKTAIPDLWPWVEEAIATAVQKGFLKPSETLSEAVPETVPDVR